MTTDSNNAKESVEILDEESVAKYLSENPDFFERKADLLLELTIPHGNRGAISLLERQVELFRERNGELQNNINDFIFNAEENDALFEKTRIVILKLLKSDTLTQLSNVIEDTLKTEFAAHASSLLFISDSDGSNIDNEEIKLRPLAPTKNILGKLFDKKRTFCCELRPEQAKFLFPDSKKEILSAAVIPVHPLIYHVMNLLSVPLYWLLAATSITISIPAWTLCSSISLAKYLPRKSHAWWAEPINSFQP